jgi:serine protease AprX
VINTSLGYNEFNDSRQNHTYSDMNGITCISSIGANMASKKGILVVASAGNDGAKTWHRIGTPADAVNILTVGAVDSLGIITNFSSRGPSIDNRIKPDVCAQGGKTIGQMPNNDFVTASGTSVSAPLIAGLSACLWQANPNATNLQVMEAVRMSSSYFSNPTNEYGYGIPDFAIADGILKRMLQHKDNTILTCILYPNPSIDFLNVEICQNETSSNQIVDLTCFDVAGRKVFKEQFETTGTITLIHLRRIGQLPSGIFCLKIETTGKIFSIKFIKTE